MQNLFTPKDYCATKQIQSLFSRWTRQVRESSLLELHDHVVSSGMFLIISFSLHQDLDITKYTKMFCKIC